MMWFQIEWFSWMISSSIVSGGWTDFVLYGSVIDINGDTTVRWKLPSGVIEAGSKARIVYQTLIDWNFELSWPNHYVNNDVLTNTATLTYKVWWNYSWVWWETEFDYDGNIYTDTSSASVKAPTPTMNK